MALWGNPRLTVLTAFAGNPENGFVGLVDDCEGGSAIILDIDIECDEVLRLVIYQSSR